MNPIKLAICIPGESMPIESVRSYGRLMLNLLGHPVVGLTGVSQHMTASSMLPYARAKVVSDALNSGATHMLMLDTDMVYPGHIIRRLLAHERPFVACNATTRRHPVRWVAKGTDGKPIDSTSQKGLTKAVSCGLAVALLERRVFEAIPSPRFNFEYTENGWRGEDIWFCDRAREAGFQPMIDNELSREVGHVGNYTFTAEDIPSDG